MINDDRVEKESDPGDRGGNRGRPVPSGLAQKGCLAALGAFRPHDVVPRRARARPLMTVTTDEEAAPRFFEQDGSGRWKLLPWTLRAWAFHDDLVG